MGYLKEDNMVTLKKNVKDKIVLNKKIDLNEFLSEIDMSQDKFNKIINLKCNRDISPEMYRAIEVFAIKNSIDTKDFCGELPEEYGERLKYFMFKHYMNQSEFSRRTEIPTTTLWKMVSGYTQIGTKYKEQICKVLTEEEFNLLNYYSDVIIPDSTDINIVNGCNLSWNIYKNEPKYFKYDDLFKDLKVNMKSYSKFMAGTIRMTKPQIKTIAKYFKCEQSDLTEDNLNLLNLKNRFGYWFASKLYSMNNSIKMFADRCNLDPDYIASIIRGESLIKDKDIRTIASYMNIDAEALVKICPKSEMELVPISEENMTLNEIVRNRISNMGYTFKEFCNVMDINHNTMATSLHAGRLPKKNREDIIRELDLQDRFPLEEEVEEPKTVEEQIKEDIEDNAANPISIDPLGMDPIERIHRLDENIFGSKTVTTAASTNDEEEVEEDVEETSTDSLQDYLEEHPGLEEAAKEEPNVEAVKKVTDSYHEMHEKAGTFDTYPFVPKSIFKSMIDESEPTEEEIANVNPYGYPGPLFNTPSAVEEETTTVTSSAPVDIKDSSMDVKDIENILILMDSMDINTQISLAKYICNITGTDFSDELSSEGILGKLARLNLVKDSIK